MAKIPSANGKVVSIDNTWRNIDKNINIIVTERLENGTRFTNLFDQWLYIDGISA